LGKIFKMKKILGIGNALVDVVTLIDEEEILQKFALPKGSMQLVDAEKSESVKKGTKNFKRTLASGGSAANTIHGLSMLNVSTGFIGSVGEDETGDFFENDLNKAGVKTFLHRRKSPTGTAVALITPDSERTFATHLGAAIELNAEDLNPSDFKEYDILYLEGYLILNRPLVEAACELAKANNMKIALDLASYNVVEAKLGDFKKIVEKYVDIIFANEEEAKAFTGLNAETAVFSLSELCETAVVKVGSDGSWLKRGDEVIKIGTIPVTCKDTTGAGDLYASGFLYGVAMNESLENCGLYGAILSGKVIEIVGARIDHSKWDEIRKMISEIKVSG
jgi:sugar/nucleoside kinase (ribokinase family)